MSLIRESLALEGIEVDKEAAKKLYLFCELLRSWNKTHSLTTLRTDEEFTEAVIDSVYPIKFLDDFKTLLDIGSGAGLPALPLAIIKKDSDFTLCEPLSKKYAFLQYAKVSLELPNVTVLKNRVEELGDMHFDLITSRAVAKSDLLMDISERLLNESGKWLFYKGEESACEVDGEKVQIFPRKKRNYLLIRK